MDPEIPTTRAAKLMDFGLARMAADAGPGASGGGSSLVGAASDGATTAGPRTEPAYALQRLRVALGEVDDRVD